MHGLLVLLKFLAGLAVDNPLQPTVQPDHLPGVTERKAIFSDNMPVVQQPQDPHTQTLDEPCLAESADLQPSPDPSPVGTARAGAVGPKEGPELLPGQHQAAFGIHAPIVEINRSNLQYL